MIYNPEKYRKDFPILRKERPPTYFDNACMSLKPEQVINAIKEYYEEYPGCGGRSTHSISRKVDEETYKTRTTTKKFINANKEEEIIFLRNTTEAINLIARTYPFNKGDIIITSNKEHNSNLLPWQRISKEKKLKHIIINTNEKNEFSIEEFKETMEKHSGKIRMVALGLTSNLDGTTIPIKEIKKETKKHGATLLLDAAQTAPHQEINVKELGADIIAFSGHKMLGPTGTGVLWGKKELLEELPQYNIGGETAKDSTYHDYEPEELPHKFEAGLQNYAGIRGLRAAIEYLKKIGLNKIKKHETKLNKIITEELKKDQDIQLIGPEEPEKRGGIYSFNIKGTDPHDIAGLLDSINNIKIRAGGHCVHSWFNNKGIKGSARASLYLYNTEEEALNFTKAIKEIKKIIKK